MKRPLSSALTLIISLFLLVEGIWGLFSPMVFGIFPTNRTHAIIHVVLGLGGLVAWKKGAGKGFCGFLGSLLIVVSVLWLAPPTRDALATALNINLAVALLNLVLGVVALVVAFTAPAPRRFGTTQAPFQRAK